MRESLSFTLYKENKNSKTNKIIHSNLSEYNAALSISLWRWGSLLWLFLLLLLGRGRHSLLLGLSHFNKILGVWGLVLVALSVRWGHRRLQNHFFLFLLWLRWRMGALLLLIQDLVILLETALWLNNHHFILSVLILSLNHNSLLLLRFVVMVMVRLANFWLSDIVLLVVNAICTGDESFILGLVLVGRDL